VLVLPAFCIHLHTCYCIGKIYLRSYRSNTSNLSSSVSDILHALRVQWRALLLTISLLLAMIPFSIGNNVALELDIQDIFKLYPDWIDCIVQSKGQDVCAALVAPFLPQPSIIFAYESIISAMGIIMFFLLAVQRQFWQDWKDFVREMVRRYKQRRVLKHMEKIEREASENFSHEVTILSSEQVESMLHVSRKEQWRSLEIDSCYGHVKAERFP